MFCHSLGGIHDVSWLYDWLQVPVARLVLFSLTLLLGAYVNVPKHACFDPGYPLKKERKKKRKIHSLPNTVLSH